MGKKVSTFGRLMKLLFRFVSRICANVVFRCKSYSGYRGAAARADQLLDTMEAKYLAGDTGLKPNTFTYNAVRCHEYEAIGSISIPVFP